MSSYNTGVRGHPVFLGQILKLHTREIGLVDFRFGKEIRLLCERSGGMPTVCQLFLNRVSVDVK